MVANISDAMLRWIAMNEAPSKRCGWRGGVLLKPRRVLDVCSTVARLLLDFCLYALFKTCADEVVQVAVQHGFRVANFHVRAQVLDTAVVEHV